MSFTTRPIEDADRDEVIALIALVMDLDLDERERRFHVWKHEESPFGPSFGRVALDEDGAVVAVRLFMRWRFVAPAGDPIDVVRAVDTATHPAVLRQGLFRRLTLEGIEDLRAAGVQGIFNTPNDQSGPGYLKLGWEPIGRAPVALRVSPRLVLRRRSARWDSTQKWGVPIDVGLPASEVDWTDRALPGIRRDRISTDVTPAFLRWRYGLPSLNYRVLIDERGEGAGIVFRVRARGSRVDLVVCQELGDVRRTVALAKQALRHARCDVAVRVQDLPYRAGFVTSKGRGPAVVWRPVADDRVRPVGDFRFAYGDLELF